MAEQNRDKMSEYLKSRPQLAKYLRSAGKFRRQDLDEIMNLSRDESNAIISTLYENRMVRKVLGDIVVEPTLHSLLRELQL
jgi:transcription initiation factor IIE alpha subunit